jgi:hypothetical protein
MMVESGMTGMSVAFINIILLFTTDYLHTDFVVGL